MNLYIFAKFENNKLTTVSLTVHPDTSCGFNISKGKGFNCHIYENGKNCYKAALKDLKKLGYKPIDDLDVSETEKLKIIAQESERYETKLIHTNIKNIKNITSKRS